MQSVGTKVVVYHKEQIEALSERLRRRKSPQIVVIDSITAMVGFTRPMFARLLEEFPDKLFIFLAHEENGKPYPAIAQHIRKLSEVKCRVEGFTAYITTRFQSKEGGGDNFVIWEEGAAAYAADK